MSAEQAETVTELVDMAAAMDPKGDLRGQASRAVAGLDRQGLEYVVGGARGSSTLTDPQWHLCLESWVRLASQRGTDWDFATAVKEWIEQTPGVDRGRSLRLANRIAWNTAGEPYRPSQEQFQGCTQGSCADYFVVALYLNRPRFLFQANELDHVLDALPATVAAWPMCKAYRGLEVLTRSTQKASEGRTLIEEAWQGAKDDSMGDRSTVLDLASQAFDIALEPDEHALDLITLCNDLERDEQSALILFRLARAHGRLADLERQSDPAGAERHLQRALVLIRDSLGKIKGDNDFSRSLAGSVRQEREMLLLKKSLDQHTNTLIAAQEELRQTERTIKEESRSNAIRSTEVLALFSSAVAFAVGAAAIGSNATSAWGSIAVGALLAMGLLGFSLLLLLASRFTTLSTLRKEDVVMASTGKWTWRVLVIISLVLSVAAVLIALLVAPRV